jgi:phenylpropionate dioxygenase-like ring-hydroxylating dioxygenase large terminal subunit
VREISWRGTVDGHVPSVDFVRVYLGAPPVVVVEDGSGPLHVVEARTSEGSRLRHRLTLTNLIACAGHNVPHAAKGSACTRDRFAFRGRSVDRG